MRRRAESLGGHVDITRESGETHVSLRLPRERSPGP
jgi:signal transduction histidine kinase